MNYTYSLEKYQGPATKKVCPSCGKKSFTRYVDGSGNYVYSDVGRCDREEKCGHHYKPGDYIRDNRIELSQPARRPQPKKPEVISYMDKKYLDMSMNHFETSNLYSCMPFDNKSDTFRKYNTGTASHWPGSTCFWYVDKDKRVRSGKIMLYAPKTGKRVKNPFPHVTWAHSVLKLAQYNYKSCLFGEHLLHEYPDKIVGLVESEKTALITDHFCPRLLWMACGALGNISDNLLKPIKDRKILLYPDAGKAYEVWCKKADYLRKKGYNIHCSGLLESYANDEEKEQGLDLADFLLKEFDAKKRIELFIAGNPFYLDCCKAFGIPLGEPLILDHCPF